MKNKFKLERHEEMYGPHFTEDCAEEVVANMRNEDGTRGAHWGLKETTQLAEQFDVDLRGEFNKYDWFVALNMIYSDFYKVIVNLTNSDHVKYFVEFAKAWLKDKDIDEGKMWKYYRYLMCDDTDYEYQDVRHYARRQREPYYEDDDYEYSRRDYGYRPYERKSRY